MWSHSPDQPSDSGKARASCRQVFAAAVPSPKRPLPASEMCPDAWSMSSIPPEPGNCSAAAFRVHAAPSPSVAIAGVSVAASRPADWPSRGANQSTFGFGPVMILRSVGDRRQWAWEVRHGI